MDTVAPNLSISSPSNGAATSSTSMDVFWNATDAYHRRSGYQYQIDGQAWSAIGPASDNLFSGLVDGSHTVSVRAIDMVGNTATASVTFIVDTNDNDPPVVSISTPSEGSISAASNVVVTWSGSDVPSGVQGYKYRIDGGSWSSMTGMTVHGFSGLADGAHTVDIMVYDRAQNTAMATVHFTVDTTAPVLTITAPSSGAFLNTDGPLVDWSATDATSGISGYQYRIDGGQWSSTTPGTGMSFMEPSQGPHTVDVKAIDNAGNSIMASVTFTVDTVDPTISITSPPSGFVSGSSARHRHLDRQRRHLRTGRLRVPHRRRRMVLARCQGEQWVLRPGAGTAHRRHHGGRPFHELCHRHRQLHRRHRAPVLTIVSPANGFNSNSSSDTVNWTSTDATSGIAGYQYRIDGQSWSLGGHRPGQPVQRTDQRPAQGRRQGH